jgi:hypothetical protein
MSHRPDDELVVPGYAMENAVGQAVIMAVADTLRFCNDQPMIDNGEGEVVFITTVDHRLVVEKMRDSGLLNVYNFIKTAKKIRSGCGSDNDSG